MRGGKAFHLLLHPRKLGRQMYRVLLLWLLQYTLYICQLCMRRFGVHLLCIWLQRPEPGVSLCCHSQNMCKAQMGDQYEVLLQDRRVDWKTIKQGRHREGQLANSAAQEHSTSGVVALASMLHCACCLSRLKFAWVLCCANMLAG